VDIKAAAIELYGMPPEEFTAARNRLASDGKATGGADAAAAIKALRQTNPCRVAGEPARPR
jgi:hypothetical protein